MAGGSRCSGGLWQAMAGVKTPAPPAACGIHLGTPPWHIMSITSPLCRPHVTATCLHRVYRAIWDDDQPTSRRQHLPKQRSRQGHHVGLVAGAGGGGARGGERCVCGGGGVRRSREATTEHQLTACVWSERCLGACVRGMHVVATKRSLSSLVALCRNQALCALCCKLHVQLLCTHPPEHSCTCAARHAVTSLAHP